jgi:hypothetical protein
MAAGAALLAGLPEALAVAGYVGPITVVTVGYALFQTANNAAVLVDAGEEERGVMAGLLSLSRNLGLVTGASVMGAVFALASRTADVASAPPAAVALGMRVTFATAAALIAVALALAARRRSGRASGVAIRSRLTWRRDALGARPRVGASCPARKAL